MVHKPPPVNNASSGEVSDAPDYRSLNGHLNLELIKFVLFLHLNTCVNAFE